MLEMASQFGDRQIQPRPSSVISSPATYQHISSQKEQAHKTFDVDISFFLFADGHHLKTLLVFVYHSGPPNLHSSVLCQKKSDALNAMPMP